MFFHWKNLYAFRRRRAAVLVSRLTSLWQNTLETFFYKMYEDRNCSLLHLKLKQIAYKRKLFRCESQLEVGTLLSIFYTYWTRILA